VPLEVGHHLGKIYCFKKNRNETTKEAKGSEGTFMNNHRQAVLTDRDESREMEREEEAPCSASAITGWVATGTRFSRQHPKKNG
jgi:hypothetical protein